MSVFAAVMTGKGTGAIATIQLYGDTAKAILEKIFKPAVEFKVGKIYVGKITDCDQTIDQVTIGCEGQTPSPSTVTAIRSSSNRLCNCSSNMGVELLTAEQLLCKTLAR